MQARSAGLWFVSAIPRTRQRIAVPDAGGNGLRPNKPLGFAGARGHREKQGFALEPMMGFQSKSVKGGDGSWKLQ